METKTIELRPYQISAVEAGLRYFRGSTKANPLIVAPTGSGKSLLIAKIAHELGENVLVIAPSKELLGQN